MRPLFLSLLLLMFCIPSLASARDITLSWDQSQDPGVTGYKIYYKVGNQSLPFDGVNLPQGDSPIIVTDPYQTSLDLTLPDDGQVYFFTATAYNDSSIESGFSDIVATDWIPLLISPANADAVASTVDLVWSSAPSGYNVTYTLYYGTDPDLVPAAAGIPGRPNAPFLDKTLNATVGPTLLALFIVCLIALRPWRIRSPFRICLTVTFSLFVFGCGGGGDSAGIDAAPDGSAPAVLFTEVVPGLTDTQLQLYDLEPGQDYYWKVVAVDDLGNSYPSETYSFSAQ